MKDETFNKWLSQLRKGYLELCVLLILNKRQSSYGFELLHIFKKAGLELNEGTLYPLLNRMYKNGWLKSRWETPTDGGHPRRFYELSRNGRLHLPRMMDAFTQNQESLNNLMELK
ncbi:MAG: PadR family transcriptional regulator [Aestuariibacter sp.]|nr:PadR family transcriptional regulator [Aestuariibacter sp.]